MNLQRHGIGVTKYSLYVRCTSEDLKLVTIFEKTTGETPEVVAYYLMQAVLTADKRIGRATRDEILDTYAECLVATRGERLSLPKTKSLPWPPETPVRLEQTNGVPARQPGSLRLNAK